MMLTLNVDMISAMTDEELVSRMTALSYIRTSRESRGHNTYDIESDICWIEREQQLRLARLAAHAEYIQSQKQIISDVTNNDNTGVVACQ